jgi:UDP-2-acetamido-3-amino-2,3-dideoxy-glucuronate N-acetyltransferase
LSTAGGIGITLIEGPGRRIRRPLELHEDAPRIAVVGSGYWGRNLVRNFHELGALAAVVESDEGRLAAIRRQYGPSIQTHRNLEPVLADGEIDGVTVATPAATHEALAAEAIMAGKDVMVEKPLALDVAGGKRLVELAEGHDRILMVGHLLWYHPAVLLLKEAMESGRLGPIRYIYSNRLNFGKFRTEENILWSFAPHDISVILGLLDEMPDKVTAAGGSYLNQGVSDVTLSTFSFPGGTKAHVFVSWLHPYKEHRLVVIGADMMASFEDHPHGASLRLYDHEVDWDGGTPAASKSEPIEVPVPTTEPLRAECAHFLACVANRNRPRTDGAEGVRVLQVLEQCQAALNAETSASR